MKLADDLADIQDRFIRAAEIERAIPEHVGPQGPRSVDLGYVHDWVDKIGWGSKRLEEERKDFWDRLGLMPSARELSELEILRAWLLAVKKPEERRALLAWARSKVGGMKFKKWCFKVEKIHPETGRHRKDRAIARIFAHLSRGDVQNYDNDDFEVLRSEAEIEHISANIPEDAVERKSPTSWMADGAFAPTLVPEMQDFSWAEKRNELRRQREARKRKKASA